MKIAAALATAVGLGLWAASSQAQSDEEFPNLVGAWDCNIDYGSYFFGILTGPYAYERFIEEQVGAAFRGYTIWVGDKPLIPEEQYDRPGHTIIAEDETTVTVREDFLGMIGWGTNNLHMVDIADDGRLDGSIVSENEIEVIASRSGEHAGLVRTRCFRAGSQ